MKNNDNKWKSKFSQCFVRLYFLTETIFYDLFWLVKYNIKFQSCNNVQSKIVILLCLFKRNLKSIENENMLRLFSMSNWRGLDFKIKRRFMIA